MEFIIAPEDLREALKEIEQAENNGFNHCLSVFKLTSAGGMSDQCRASYSDICEKGHPTDPNLDWGRFQGVTKCNKFVDGKLISIGEGQSS